MVTPKATSSLVSLPIVEIDWISESQIASERNKRAVTTHGCPDVLSTYEVET